MNCCRDALEFGYMSSLSSVFVYGTLLPGLERSSALDGCLSCGPAIIQADLFDFGPYPGIRTGSGSVVGEVFRVNDAVLASLDLIEGYQSKAPKDSLFVRQQVSVRSLADAGESEVFTYFAQQDGGTLIPSGDYRRHRLEAESKNQWIVSYGSNMGTKRLIRRVGELSEIDPGEVLGYELVFNKAAGKDNTAYANIRHSPDGESCPAVAYKLSPRQIDELDPYEGVATGHYLRVGVLFQSGNGGQPKFAQTYIAHPNKIVLGAPIRPDYFQHVLNGYREYGFDESLLPKPIVH